eukprot:TRINITY_DN3611_c0_g2_i2.p1 TRINITY_DN3611_c0_g2~~TRINITY_DN3611_c0_g2_i2.p1  ORF type:complete len:122 (-),score=22.03 TRINITY_DN3611_c0_g2_i2:170-535(-)
MGLYPMSSLMNHSCVPNLQIQRTLNNKTVFIALRTIKPNEELTFDYLDVSEQYGENNKSFKFDNNYNDFYNKLYLDENSLLDVVENFYNRQKKMKDRYQIACFCKLCLRDQPLVQKLMNEQ